jgi:hypothetical protein
MHLNRTIIIFFLLLLIMGCEQRLGTLSTSEIDISGIKVTVEPAASTLEPYKFKTSEPGNATLHGILLTTDPHFMVPDPNDAIFLVPLTSQGDGPMTIPLFEVGDVPQAEVNEITGEFYFTNIQPGQYAIVVLAKSGGQIPARWYKDDAFAIITIEDEDLGKVIELEYLTFP